MSRTIEKVDAEKCGCYVQRITDTWMGKPIVYENHVFCFLHW